MSLLRRRHGGRRPGLADLTPLVDMSLMLVVFLFLSAGLPESDSLPVELPVAEGGRPGTEAPLDIAVLSGGELAIDGRQVDLDTLVGLARGRSQVVLRADRACRHGRVVEVMDRLRTAGVAEIRFATRKPTGPAEW